MKIAELLKENKLCKCKIVELEKAAEGGNDAKREDVDDAKSEEADIQSEDGNDDKSGQCEEIKYCKRKYSTLVRQHDKLKEELKFCKRQYSTLTRGDDKLKEELKFCKREYSTLARGEKNGKNKVTFSSSTEALEENKENALLKRLVTTLNN